MSKVLIEEVAFFTDSHCGVRNDSTTFLDYQEEFYRDVFFPELKSRNIKKIIHGGDYFDRRKFVNFQSFKRNMDMFINPLEDAGIDMVVIAGNHDVALKNTNEVNSLMLLLNQSPNIDVVWEKPVTRTYGKTDVDLIPWINASNYKDTMNFVGASKSPVCIGHFEFAGFEMYKGVKNDEGMKTSSFASYSNVYSGHFHTRSKRGNIAYLGAPMEFTWADYDDPRGFSIFKFYDDGSHEVEFIKNPKKMFYCYRYNDSDGDVAYHDLVKDDVKNRIVKIIVESKEDPYKFDLFMKELERARPFDVKVVDLIELNVDSSEIDESSLETKDTVTVLCDHIDAIKRVKKSRKTEAKRLLRDIYTQSLQEIDL